MPSGKKLAHFLSSAALCAAGVAVLGYGMSTDWADGVLDCAPLGGDFNGSSTLTTGLFNGSETKIRCPRIDSSGKVNVFNRLAKLAGAPIILHGLVVILLALAILGSAGSILVTLYNSFSNPYQTYMGPIGLYTCSGLSVCVSTLALILYVSNIYLGEMLQTLVKAEEAGVNLKDPQITLRVGFFLLIPYIATNLLAILVVYLYVHAAYTRRKEQEKPTEDAPKEIMMY